MPAGPSRPLLLLLVMWVAAAAVLPHVVSPVRAQAAANSTAKVSTPEPWLNRCFEGLVMCAPAAGLSVGCAVGLVPPSQLF
jgi:hypothetical protein